MVRPFNYLIIHYYYTIHTLLYTISGQVLGFVLFCLDLSARTYRGIKIDSRADPNAINDSTKLPTSTVIHFPFLPSLISPPVYFSLPGRFLLRFITPFFGNLTTSDYPATSQFQIDRRSISWLPLTMRGT